MVFRLSPHMVMPAIKRKATAVPLQRYYHFMVTTKRHQERRLVTMPMEHIFNVVADVDKYHEFVPFCKGSKVVSRKEVAAAEGEKEEKAGTIQLEADLVVGFQYVNEKYTSHVTLAPYGRVSAISSETELFESMKSEWRFMVSRE